jgi:hypothetical protein
MALAVYVLVMCDDRGAEESVAFDAEPDVRQIEQECEEWVSCAEWPSDGAAVRVAWRLTRDDGEVMIEGKTRILVAADIDAADDWKLDHDEE